MSCDHSTLILLHSVVRHGHRAPDLLASYPKDPYKNHDFYPYGIGMLTNKGKREMYTVGKDFRRRYNTFLGDLYFPSLLEVWSTEWERCMTSAQLLLAGLFPPRKVQQWNEDGLDWQPIPINYKAKTEDKILAPILFHPRYSKIQEELFQTAYGKALLEKHKDLIPYIEEHTGWEVKSTRPYFLLGDILRAYDEFGLEIPKWAKILYPEKIWNIRIDDYEMQIGTKELRRRSSGLLLKKILEDSMDKINNKSLKKMHLYVCHETNIAYLLIILCLMYRNVPNFSASLTLELHKIDDRFGFKIFYKNGADKDFEAMLFPDGREIFWIEDLKMIVDDLFDIDENDTKLLYDL